VEVGFEGVEFVAKLMRKFGAEDFEEFGDGLGFDGPFGGVDKHELIHGGLGNVEAVESKGAGSGHVADGSFGGGGAAFDAFEHPLQDANVFAIAGPEEFAVGTTAKPIYVENFWRIFDARAHAQPVLEIFGHVVAAEGKHGHGVAAGDADGSSGGGGCFGSESGAHEDTVLPVA